MTKAMLLLGTLICMAIGVIYYSVGNPLAAALAVWMGVMFLPAENDDD